jgi:tRNA(adenine34) deaminase
MKFPGGILPTVAEDERDEQDLRLMRIALDRAEAAAEHGDVPIGAVIARGGELLAAAGNERELRGDPTAHAEILALRETAGKLGGWRLPGTTIYVTLEPCTMCAGAISLARVERLVFAAPDPKTGAAGSVIDVFASAAVNHRPAVESGLLAAEASAQLASFFSSRR